MVQSDKALLQGDEGDPAFHHYVDPTVGMPVVQMNQKQDERALVSPALENQGWEVTDGLMTLGKLQAPGSISNQGNSAGASHSTSRQQSPDSLTKV